MVFPVLALAALILTPLGIIALFGGISLLTFVITNGTTLAITAGIVLGLLLIWKII